MIFGKTNRDKELAHRMKIDELEKRARCPELVFVVWPRRLRPTGEYVFLQHAYRVIHLVSCHWKLQVLGIEWHLDAKTAEKSAQSHEAYRRNTLFP